jgi:hypothetical protein
MNRRPGRDEAQAFDDAWESGAPASAEVAALVRAAEALCEAAVAAPRPEFRAALRERLMTEAQTVLVPAPGASRPTPVRAVPEAPTASPRRRRLAGIAVAAVSSLGVVGMVAGSASAIPGDVLYPVKRGVENVELALQRTDEGRGTQRLEIAAERLAEARALVADGSPGGARQVDALLDDFSSDAELGSADLFGAYGTGGSAAPIDAVNDFAAASAVDLSTLAADVPEEAQDALQAAADVVTDVAGQAARLCASCGTADVGSLRGTISSVAARPSTTGSGSQGSTSQDDDEPATGSASTEQRPSPSAVSTTQPVVQAPTVPAPSVAPTQKGLRSVTDPLVGGLLGDDDTEGLVPGLLNGLLGTPEK